MREWVPRGEMSGFDPPPPFAWCGWFGVCGWSASCVWFGVCGVKRALCLGCAVWGIRGWLGGLGVGGVFGVGWVVWAVWGGVGGVGWFGWSGSSWAVLGGVCCVGTVDPPGVSMPVGPTLGCVGPTGWCGGLGLGGEPVPVCCHGPEDLCRADWVLGALCLGYGLVSLHSSHGGCHGVLLGCGEHGLTIPQNGSYQGFLHYRMVTVSGHATRPHLVTR